jgi:hypothetical protein
MSRDNEVRAEMIAERILDLARRNASEDETCFDAALGNTLGSLLYEVQVALGETDETTFSEEFRSQFLEHVNSFFSQET